jgi:hypothetical protein
LNKIFAKISILFLIALFITACNAVKKVPSKKYLLTKNKLEVDGKIVKDENITAQIIQQPNSTFLGYPLRLQMYNLAKENADSIFKAKFIDNQKKYNRLSKLLSKKQVHRLGKSFWYSGWPNFLKRTGEAPVIIDSLKTIRTTKRLKALYENEGYLRAKSSFKINFEDNKRGNIEYFVNKGEPYILDTIYKDIPNKKIDSLYSLVDEKSLIKYGDQYKETNFSGEISRLTEYFRNKGVYHFQQQNIVFEVDTATTKTPVIIKITDQKVKQGDSTVIKPLKIYKIGKVNIITNDKATKMEKAIADSVVYKNFHLYSTNKLRFRPKAITDAIFIQKDSLFSDQKRTQTLSSLNNLRIFNFPSIFYQENPEDQTLTANIILTAKDKYSFRANADITHSNIQDFGLSGNLSFSIRNLFRGAEILELGLRGNIGSSKDFANPKDQLFNIQEYGADIRLTFPRLFLPFKTNKIIPKTMYPSTYFSAGFAKQQNIGLDKENFTSVLNYSWTPSAKTNVKFDFVNLQYVKNVNIANYFNVYTSSYNQLNDLAQIYNNDPLLVDSEGNLTKEKGGADTFMENATNGSISTLDPNSSEYKTIKSIKERKQRLTENNLIFASNFSYSKTSQKDFFDKEFYSFKTKIESAGNIMSLIADISKQPKNSDGSRNIFGLQYSQYIKGEFDYIKHWDLKHNKSIAFRSFFGMAIPYGNSKSIPFSRSYFAGGSNDNRGWQSYSLGPGSSGGTNDFNEANMKITLNTEFRFKFFGNLNGALFADCGNIWNIFDSETDEKKVFSGIKSLKDIALGTGIGFRYDFSFFVFRLDWGFKTYNPALDENRRWLTEMALNKSVLNIGINYPF